MTPNQLLNMLPVAILYEQIPGVYGHWTLLLDTPDGIEFFDSYGAPVDTEFKDIEYKQPHYLAKMLLKLHKITNINYSPYHFQALKQNVATCGRWVVLRSLFSDWGIDHFAKAVFDVSKKLHISPDELVTEATSG